MAEATVALQDYLRKLNVEVNPDFLREGLQLLLGLLMEAEVSARIGAAPHERTPARKTQRNGYREREWQTHEKCIAAAQRAFDAFMSREKVYANLADIAQLQGLCERMDEEAFLPLRSEELTGQGAARVLQYCQLADRVTDIMVEEGIASIMSHRVV